MQDREPHSPWKDRHAFLRALLLKGAPEEKRHLLLRIRQAEREERWSRRALKLALLVALACFTGWWMVSSANPEAVEAAAVFAADLLKGAATASGFVLSLVLGCWLWNRNTLNRIEQEGARYVLGMIESKTAVSN